MIYRSKILKFDQNPKQKRTYTHIIKTNLLNYLLSFFSHTHMWPVCYQFTIGGVSLNGQRSTSTVTFYSIFAADVTLVIQVGFVCRTVILSQTLQRIFIFQWS